jgi:hypothetical protein
MNDKNFGRDLRKGQKERWLGLADNYLRNSGNEFLEYFCDFLKEGYKDSEQLEYAFKKPSWATEKQVMLKNMLDSEAFGFPSTQVKGFALIGKTDFNKLEFIKEYFIACGLSEFTGGETEGRYAVVDCSDIRGHNGLIKSLVKNQDVAYIIFDKCDSLLKHDEVLQMFKQLSEDDIGLTLITKNDETVNFKTDSAFVFLGEENTLHLAVEKQILKGQGLDTSASSHFHAFLRYIHVYDLDKDERYYGHDVPMIHN